MTDRESRERLVELIAKADTHDSYECKLCTKKDTSCTRCGAEKLADHLIANGVVVLKQGVWKDNNNGTFTCSVCGGRASKMSCRGNCGAKLKEREKV